MDKKELRAEIRRRKKEHSAEELGAMSAEVMNTLEDSDFFLKANTVLLYYSLPDEVSTHAFEEKWKTSKKILLPVVCGDILHLRVYEGNASLYTGAFNIEEPQGNEFTDFSDIDLAVIPGMAFDRDGHRLGRGKGFYDKLLPGIKCRKIGLCFSFQLADSVPIEPHDIVMDMVLTDDGFAKL